MNEKNENRTIVVGVDGSPASREALFWAAKEAEMKGARLHAVQAWQPPTGGAISAVGSAPTAAFSAQDVSAHTKRELAKTIKETIGESPTIDLRASVAVGNPVKVLIGVAKEDDAELLVLGSRGRGGFKSLLLGSVSEQCVTHAECPVAVIHTKKARKSEPAQDAAEA
ncbi:MAG: universal stress protein [Actinomycetes bacterium]